jgi:[NiFe] hydrogenase diaphorase moiety large subunit
MTVKSILEKYGNEQSNMMNILIDIRNSVGYIPNEAITLIAEKMNISEVDVEQTRSFYHFLTNRPTGKYAVYLNNSVTSGMMGCKEIAAEFEKQAGCKFGEVSEDGLIGLSYTACIGMSDQEPAAIINGKVFTKLSRSEVATLVDQMKIGKTVEEMITSYGDGNNSHQLVKAMVQNNIRKEGPVIFSAYESGISLKKALNLASAAVIDEVKKSGLRGRGGAGFPTGMKWDFCARNEGEHFVLCNADEGEPGTFKDRVLITEKAKMVFEGMTIAGYAIGAKEGIMYLRYEYSYLKAYLENLLEEMRKENMLGKNVAGKQGFDFDIRIQFGAGAYVCGEESALIESIEGKRGEPRNRPPFPVQKGYMNKPTIINNVETFCATVKIIENGGDWYKGFGTDESAGTKVLSISGDCRYPGVYEIEWGMTITEMLEMCGAEEVQAVQVAGPSGVCLNPSQFGRKIALEDLATGGAMIVIGNKRDLLKDVVLNFMEFFVEESCGSCTPCRGMNVLLRDGMEKIIHGKGVKKDLADLEEYGRASRKLNRCGLGQSSSNPVISTLENFKPIYEKRVNMTDEFESQFDMAKAVAESCDYVGRVPNIH